MKPNHSSPERASPRIGVALVEDDPHFVQFLEAALNGSARHRVVARAESAEAALAWNCEEPPLVALLDIGLPGRPGSSLVADLVQRYPQLVIIMLTARTNDDEILESIRTGAVGYVLKGGTAKEILTAIDDALAGGAPMSPSIARKLLDVMRNGLSGRAGTAGSDLPALTPHEEQVMRWVAQGASDCDVAARLGVTRSQVKNCLLGVYAKWRVKSRTQAAVKFVRHRQKTV
jgi:DNA-binding NarL/FixJ family response regulator